MECWWFGCRLRWLGRVAVDDQDCVRSKSKRSELPCDRGYSRSSTSYIHWPLTPNELQESLSVFWMFWQVRTSEHDKVWCWRPSYRYIGFWILFILLETHPLYFNTFQHIPQLDAEPKSIGPPCATRRTAGWPCRRKCRARLWHNSFQCRDEESNPS